MIFVYTKDGQVHDYPIASHAGAGQDDTIINVVRVELEGGERIGHIVAFFPIDEVLKVEYFDRSKDQSSDDGLPVQ